MLIIDIFVGNISSRINIDWEYILKKRKKFSLCFIRIYSIHHLIEANRMIPISPIESRWSIIIDEGSILCSIWSYSIREEYINSIRRTSCIIERIYRILISIQENWRGEMLSFFSCPWTCETICRNSWYWRDSERDNLENEQDTCNNFFHTHAN